MNMWSRHQWEDVSTELFRDMASDASPPIIVENVDVVVEGLEDVDVMVEGLENVDVVIEELEDVDLMVEELENVDVMVEELEDESSPPIIIAVNFETTSTPSKPKRRWLLRAGRGKIYAVEGLFE